MRTCLALFIVAALAVAGFAGEIEKGAAMQVKPNSIWFQDAAQLAHWQKLKKSGNAKALASYQERLLSEREAWQFLNPLAVKIVGYQPKQRRVDVEMTSEGRMKGTTWLLDPDALAQ